MDSYTSLVDKVLQCKELASQIEKLASDEQTLNLIVPDWEKRLDNNATFQSFKNHAKDMYGAKRTTENKQFTFQAMNQSMKILLLGSCAVYTPYEASKYKNQCFSINIRESPVLDKLMKGLNSDVTAENVEFSDTCKINFQACSLCCKYCSAAIEEMKNQSIKLKFDCIQPCITDIMVYDGKQAVNRFASQISGCFRGGFKAIIQLEINLRYFYYSKEPAKDQIKPKPFVRMGGNAIKMIVFPENNLKEASVFLGNLSIPCQLDGDTPEFAENVPKRALESDEESVINVLPNKIPRQEDVYSVSEEMIEFN